MKQTHIICNGCGNDIPNSKESDYYILNHKIHYMIPQYDAEMHFCSKDCIRKYFTVGGKQ